MKSILLLLLISISVTAQNCDTLITTNIYTVCFNKNIKNPLYVSYKLYNGGGDCGREGMRFKENNIPGEACAKDYKGSGYDKGHLCNAEDFAFNCQYEEETFRYYNCVPQTPHLNRGIWKHYETAIRKLSHQDSLLIITGAVYGIKTLPNSDVMVPDKCWKVVQSLTTKEILFCFIIANDNVCIDKMIPVTELQMIIGYNLLLK